LDRPVAEVDRAVGVLEVVAGRDLAPRLVDGVADLLAIDFGDDVERRHGTPGGGSARLVSYAPPVGTRVAKGGSLSTCCESYAGSNPARPTRAPGVQVRLDGGPLRAWPQSGSPPPTYPWSAAEHGTQFRRSRIRTILMGRMALPRVVGRRAKRGGA